MRRAAKAAKFLSRFNMANIEEGEFTVYVKTDGDYLDGIGCDYKPGCEDPVDYCADFRKWRTKRYADFLANPEHDIKESDHPEVVAVVVNFKVPDDKKLYVLECTDFTTMNSFDRLIIEEICHDTIEMYLTPSESEALHGTSDVLKLCERLPIERRVADYKGDLPIVVVKRNARQRFRGLARA